MKVVSHVENDPHNGYWVSEARKIARVFFLPTTRQSATITSPTTSAVESLPRDESVAWSGGELTGAPTVLGDEFAGAPTVLGAGVGAAVGHASSVATVRRAAHPVATSAHWPACGPSASAAHQMHADGAVMLLSVHWVQRTE